MGTWRNAPFVIARKVITNNNVMSIPNDLANQRFGRLLAIEPSGKDKKRNILWRCICDCGNETVLSSYSLKKITRSCGCLQKEAAGRIAIERTTHGQSRGGIITPEYQAFMSAKARCTYTGGIGYERYGGRGIEFRFTSFKEFYEALGPKPSPEHSVDRWPNNDGHYEAGNVRWATKTEQANNRRYLTKPRSDTTSGFLGVTFDKARGKYMASITVSRKLKNLGRFSTPEEAHQAYLSARENADRPLESKQ